MNPLPLLTISLSSRIFLCMALQSTKLPSWNYIFSLSSKRHFPTIFPLFFRFVKAFNTLLKSFSSHFTISQVCVITYRLLFFYFLVYALYLKIVTNVYIIYTTFIPYFVLSPIAYHGNLLHWKSPKTHGDLSILKDTYRRP